MIRLKELRQEHGWNMKKAAQKLDLPYTTYIGYEKGEREPNSEQLIRFADFYGVSVDYLIGNVNDPFMYVDSERTAWEANDPGNGSKFRRSVTDADLKFALFGGDGEITDAMFEEVKRFAAFVKQREQEKEANKD